MRRPGRELLTNPGRVIVGSFVAAIAVGTALLSLPVATASGRGAGAVNALFTATSAVCVTGLITVDTGTYWSGFGQVVILLLIQAGGLGIATLASLVAVLFTRRLGLRARQVAQAETKALTASDLRRLIRRIVLVSITAELITAVILTTRFATTYDEAPGRAAYDGVFHAVSAFNNAGFSLNADSLTRYVADPVVVLTVCLATIVGGIGFPVLFELKQRWRHPATWSVLTRITVPITLALLLLGTLAVLATESRNPATLGALGPGGKLQASLFASTMARTTGFNSIDIGALRPETLFVTDVLMFIGGGSAGTAGGIKITTFGLLAYVLWAEVRGRPDVEVSRRRVPAANQRQALTVALLAVGTVVVAVLILLPLEGLGFDAVLFETISAFATVGLSTGITAALSTPAHLLLTALMLIGRLEPLTLASALALREGGRPRRLPEQRTIVG